LTQTVDLTRESVAAVDAKGQLDDILGMPDQLRDAMWRVESADLEPHESPGGLIVAGMGGSAIGGALARAALGDRASRPIVLARGYALPAWTTPDTTVLCASYSGNTEETLGVYEAAGALGARRIVATTGGKLADAARAEAVPVIPLPGGFQPRAAVAYSLVVALEVAAMCGAGERLHAEIDVAAAHAEQARAKVLARAKGFGVNKTDVLAETGYPWGQTTGAAVGSEANQARYLKDLHAYSVRSNLTYFFFEAFDENWKGAEGPVGAKWGMWNSARTTPQQVISTIDTLIPAQDKWPPIP
jgi:hypothetical protein